MIITDFSKKDLVEVEKISYLWRRSRGTLAFFWEKAEWMERNLCRNTFPFEKNHYRTFIYFWLNFHESAIRIFTFVLFSFSSDVNQMFKACVCHFSLFLKEKYISSLFQTKYIEKKFNLQLFFLPIVSWAFTLAWATTRCPPS